MLTPEVFFDFNDEGYEVSAAEISPEFVSEYTFVASNYTFSEILREYIKSSIPIPFHSIYVLVLNHDVENDVYQIQALEVTIRYKIADSEFQTFQHQQQQQIWRIKDFNDFISGMDGYL